MADETDGKKKVSFYRLEDLEVTEVALVDRPAIGIEFLVLKRLSPDGQPAAAGEEGKAMTTKRSKAAGEGGEGDGQSAAEKPALTPEMLRTLKAMGSALAGFLPKPEEMPEGDELTVAAWAFQAAAEKAEETAKEEEPMDFRSAWEGMVMTDQLWKCLMTMENVVMNIARSDKTPEEKGGLFDSLITDFSDVARELLGLAKAAPAETEGGDAGGGESGGGETSKSAGDPSKETDGDGSAEAETDLSKRILTALTAIPDLLTEVRELGERLDKVETGSETPEAPATDGAAETKKADTSTDERPTMAEVLKAIETAIQAARHPVFKSRIPKQEPPEGEGNGEGGEAKPTGPLDRTARRKRLFELNAAALAYQGIPQAE